MDKKHTGEPLGHPHRTGQGNARPAGAGEEGGSGFLGDQRQEHTNEGHQENKNDPALDGIVKKEHIEGDDDIKRPGARLVHDKIWNGPRLSMEQRKREPLIIW